MFDRVYLINLKRRPDRIANFHRLQVENGWKLPQPEIFQAIEGDKVGLPAYFTQGGGAWGCLRSHVTILERCIMDDVGTVLMLEDDVTWMTNAWERLETFMSEVPSDWQQLMLGGQHIRPAKPHSTGVTKCNNCQRTHAYAIRQPAMKSLLNLWYTCSVHIDWSMGDWQKAWKVYAPDPFIFGQAGGKSDISGRLNPSLYWNSPQSAPVVILDAPPEVVKKLRGHGFHTGFDRDENDIDRGLVSVAKSDRKDRALHNWLQTLLWECASMEGHIVAVYHPEITADDVKKVHQGEVIEVKGTTVEECLAQVKHLKLKQNRSATHVLVLRAAREVAEGLGGFHRGFWIDSITGQDNGQREIAVSNNKTPLIQKWLKAVGDEAERAGSVPLIWCDGISVADMQTAAPERTIIEITASSVDDVLRQWKELTAGKVAV